MIPYERAPLLLYRGEGNLPYLRNMMRFSVFLAEAFDYAIEFPGEPKLLILDGVENHRRLIYNSAVKTNASAWYKFPNFNDKFCEAIVDLSQRGFKQEILEVSLRILERNIHHPNYIRDKKRLEEMITQI